jgi:SAM-dependent methyltransferase
MPSHKLTIRGGQPFTRHTLGPWLQSRRGRRLLALETRELRRLLPDLFGRHILQIGNWGRGGRLLGGADMLHKAVLGTIGDTGVQSVVEAERLPVLGRSVDAVLLPHTLEFSPLPHEVLRESSRILTDRGRLLILGFSPWSPWGLRQGLGLRYPAFPPGARFVSTARLCEWLQLLDFEVMLIRRYAVGIPCAGARGTDESSGLRSLLDPLREAYLIMAKKHVVPMTLVGRVQRAHVRSQVPGAIGAAVPSARGLPRQAE